MATNSNILAWEMPGTEEPGGLQSMGSERIRQDLETKPPPLPPAPGPPSLQSVTSNNKPVTCKDDPTTRRESASFTLLCTKSTLSGFTVSPKKTTSGFRGPPHREQDGTWKLCTSSSVRKTSPSGARPWASALQVGFRTWNRSCSTPRGVCSPQSKQRTLKPQKGRLTWGRHKLPETFHPSHLQLLHHDGFLSLTTPVSPHFINTLS